MGKAQQASIRVREVCQKLGNWVAAPAEVKTSGNFKVRLLDLNLTSLRWHTGVQPTLCRCAVGVERESLGNVSLPSSSISALKIVQKLVMCLDNGPCARSVCGRTIY